MSVSPSLGEQKTVSLPEGNVVYRERGRGEPIVFLHALLLNGDEWREVVPKLARGRRCITPDLPFGSHTVPMSASADLSMPALANWLADFLDAIGVRRATLVGSDAGGVLAQVLIERHPDRVERTVLACCDAFADFPPKDFRILKYMPYIPGSLLLVSLALMIRPFRRSRAGQRLFITQDPDPEILRSYLRPALKPAIRRDLAKVLRAVSPEVTLSAAASFAERQLPVLIAWASDDQVFAPGNSQRLAAAFPHGTLKVIPASRVFIPEDAPAALAEEIERFLSANPVAESAPHVPVVPARSAA